MYCSNCRKELALDGQFCPDCGAKLEEAAPPPVPQQYALQQSEPLRYDQQANRQDDNFVYCDVSSYYQRKFVLFDQNNGAFKATWNWWAFLFGAIWYIYKGMWGKGLLIIVLTFLLGGIPGFVFWAYTAVVGNYDYYLLKRKGTQWWK